MMMIMKAQEMNWGYLKLYSFIYIYSYLNSNIEKEELLSQK